MPYNYSDQQVKQRASSGGKDPGRMATADKLFAQATQPPHEDDAAALSSLKALSGLAPGVDQNGERTEGWATADARNYGKMLLAKADPSYQAQYDHANDGSFKPMHALGGVMKFAAPFAGMIPGVGIPLAAGLGAGGNALGNLAQGNGFDLKGALLSGAAGAAGSALTGGQGFKGLAGAPHRMGLTDGIANGPGQAALNGAASASGMPAVAAATGGGGGPVTGVLGKIGLGNIAKAGIAGAGMLDSRAQRQAAERMSNSRLDLYNRQLGMAEQDYASRAPLRNTALERLGTLMQRPSPNAIYGG
jgi:hypothetical protein